MSHHDCLVGAIDQGTSSSRFLIFSSKTAELVTYHQTEIEQINPKEGWTEEDPMEILQSVKDCMEKAVDNLKALKIDPIHIKCIGIANQRETTVVWDKLTGEPLYNAIVWLDLRTASTVDQLIAKTPKKSKDSLRSYCGLPITTYFSAVKLKWLIDNSEKVRKAIAEGRCMFGTVDTWLLWNLTGGKNGGQHVTDVTNASRTMLMNVRSLQWDDYLCKFFDVPKEILPEIKSCSEIYGNLTDGPLKGLPISGILGDQQAALVGQLCFKPGQAKNTYGTGCFLLMNTGTQLVDSTSGLLTTVGYQLGKDKPVIYALEGAIAIAGACVRWLRDNLGIIETSSDIEKLASKVDSTHGCYFVPAFSGLFCPYWQADARGIICGLTQFTNKEHIARAALEAVCFQTRELLEAMNGDSGIPLKSLQVDGGMTANNLLMQLQADLMGINVVRPSMPETTALGAAMAAGAAEGVGIWSLESADLTKVTTDTFSPSIGPTDRDQRFSRWKKAVERSMNWADKSDTHVEKVNDLTNGLSRTITMCIPNLTISGFIGDIHLKNNNTPKEKLASKVDSTHGCYFVPAFSGLFCPYWQADARGIICGLTQFTNKEHIARAALEAVCFQTRELLEAMNGDSGIPLKSLQVDGGMTANNLLMQLQADLMGISVVRPSMPETTALGAAMAAGAAEGVGIWSLESADLTKVTTDTFSPSIGPTDRDQRFSRWKKAVERSMNWADKSDTHEKLASKVDSTHGCCFVPAFSGLFCPYWQADARGIICGLTQFTNKEHIARAALEAVCFQTRELLEAMNGDSGIPLKSLQVDGGMTANNLLMQLQADLMGISVVRPSMPETTALGAAMAAGAAEGVGIWSLESADLTKVTTDTFSPSIGPTDRDQRFSRWKKAVERSMNWADKSDTHERLHSHLDVLAGGLYMWSSFLLLIVARYIQQNR